MDCLDEDQVLAFVGGALAPTPREQVEQHLDGCPECLELVTLASATSQARGNVSRDDDAGLPTVDPERYVLGAELARGGMGRITAARDRRLGRNIAIKEVLAESAAMRARFEREVRITARLQHPAIVSLLEAGVWPSGEPFYAMRLVSGEALDNAITRCTSLVERLALLPNVIAAVDGIAYAHSQRVIHRDLKPANVLVGDFGETVVIDWGLAKAFDDADLGDLAHGSGPVSATQTGAVVGTPRYMAPEQARGETVDERADVYALGAMLYHLLCGEPPYTGANADAILAELATRPPPPLAQRAPDTPRDLVAIIDKAMALNAADRYPTAKELADDLKRFQAGRLVGAHRYSAWQLVGRWIGRHRAAVAVAAVAMLALAAVGAVGIRRTMRAQAHAEEQRTAAEDLMSFMLVDLRDKVKPLGRIDLLDDVARKAIAYYDQQEVAAGDAELAKRAVARKNLGDVLVAQGHGDAALAQYEAALATRTALVARHPEDVERRRDLWEIHLDIGDVVFARGETARAKEEYQTSLGLAPALGAREVAVTHQKLGDLFAIQGAIAESLAERREVLKILSQLAAASPSNAGAQRDLSVAEEKLGLGLVDQGASAEALAQFRAALAIRAKIAATDPSNADRQRDVSIIRDRIGDVLRHQGDAKAALAEYQAALTIRTTLANADPTNASRQYELTLSHENISDILRARGDVDGALAQLQASNAIRKALAARDPTNADRSLELASSYQAVGDLLRIHGDSKGALAQYHEAAALADALAAKDPTNSHDLRTSASVHDSTGEVLLGLGDPAAALVEYRASHAILVKLAGLDATNIHRQRDLAIGYDRIGDVQLRQGDAAGAVSSFRESLHIRIANSARDPANVDYQRDLVASHGNLGDALLALGDRSQALDEHRQALTIAAELAALAPDDTGRQEDLGVSHVGLGDVLLARGDANDAIAEYRSAVAIRTTLASRDAANADWQTDLAASYNKLGDALRAHGARAPARAAYARSLALARKLPADSADARDLITSVTKKLGMHE